MRGECLVCEERSASCACAAITAYTNVYAAAATPETEKASITLATHDIAVNATMPRDAVNNIFAFQQPTARSFWAAAAAGWGCVNT